MIKKYTVFGMSCAACIAHVTEEVSKIPGVTEVQLDETGILTLTSDKPVDFRLLVAAVEEAGEYSVE